MMAKYEAWQLKQRQSLPLELKIKMTKTRIQEWYEHWDGQVYVSFSGGKDSTVLKHIVDSMYSDVPSVFVNTGLEYPEIQSFARGFDNVVVIRPKMTFSDVIKKYGYPVISKEISEVISGARTFINDLKEGCPQPRYASYYRRTMCLGEYDPNNENCESIELALEGQPYRGRGGIPKENRSSYNVGKWRKMLDADFEISNKCCDVMKKKPCKDYEKQTGRKAIIGTMASESVARKQAWLRTGCNAFEGNAKSQPMSFWTEQDVLQYIYENNIEISSVYGNVVLEDGKYKTTGCNRTGCIFCGFGCHLEKTPNRFEKLKETHPRQWDYCINGGEYVDGMWKPNENGLGLGRVLDYIGVNYDS